MFVLLLSALLFDMNERQIEGCYLARVLTGDLEHFQGFPNLENL